MAAAVASVPVSVGAAAATADVSDECPSTPVLRDSDDCSANSGASDTAIAATSLDSSSDGARSATTDSSVPVPVPVAAAAAAGAGALDSNADDNDRPLILVTTIDIAEGLSDDIEVRAGDEPRALAEAFIAKHGLPAGVVGALVDHLREHLEAAEAARAGMLTEDSGEDGGEGAGADGAVAGDAAGSGAAAGSGGSDSGGAAGAAGEPDWSNLDRFERLYREALHRRRKLEAKTARAQQQADAAIAGARLPISCLSQEIAAGRGAAGAFKNYGEMLYLESKQGEKLRRLRVRAVGGARVQEKGASVQ